MKRTFLLRILRGKVTVCILTSLIVVITPAITSHLAKCGGPSDSELVMKVTQPLELPTKVLIVVPKRHD